MSNREQARPKSTPIKTLYVKWKQEWEEQLSGTQN